MLSRNHFVSLRTNKDNCIPQHLARVFSIIGMLDFEHRDCVQCLCGLPDCTDCIGDSKLPFLFAFLVLVC